MNNVISWAKNLESSAENQINQIASLPFIHKHVAVMPDAHAGKGSTVGTVIATEGAIIPAAVGVDIGCGMTAVRLKVKIDDFKDSASKLRSLMESRIPVGHRSHTALNYHTEKVAKNLNIQMKHALQIGTLGGGNHFIEICYDENNDAWVMLHSGSRNLGKTLADVHIEKAKGIMKSYFISLPDPDLAYLAQGTNEFDEYLTDLLLAQEYALSNRKEMMRISLNCISDFLYGEQRTHDDLIDFKIDSHHNFTRLENHYNKNVWITRKGAVSARAGEYGIIPGSMGDKSYIVKGKGNIQSFCSCSHGAGRIMSRTQARKKFTEKDLIESTAGVDCKKDSSVIDEIPNAYKRIDEVMKSQEDLVEIVHTLKQIICIKG